MKKFSQNLSLALAFVCLQQPLQAANYIPSDIVVSTRVDFDWSTILVKKIRGAMINNGMADTTKSYAIFC